MQAGLNLSCCNVKKRVRLGHVCRAYYESCTHHDVEAFDNSNQHIEPPHIDRGKEADPHRPVSVQRVLQLLISLAKHKMVATCADIRPPVHAISAQYDDSLVVNEASIHFSAHTLYAQSHRYQTCNGTLGTSLSGVINNSHWNKIAVGHSI